MGRPPAQRLDKERIGAFPSLPSTVVKSAGRTAQILEYFDDVQRDVSIVEVAEALRSPQSSIGVILKSLVELGFLELTPRRTYALSYRVAMLGSWMDHSLFGRGQLRSLMERISAESGEFVVLAQRVGMHAKFIQVVQAAKPGRRHITVGTERCLLRSGTGRTLLSMHSDLEVAKLIRRFNASVDDAGRVDAAEVMGTINSIRQNGYAMTLDAVTHGGGVISVPVTRDTRPGFALGIASTSMTLRRNETAFANLLREGVQRLFASPGRGNGPVGTGLRPVALAG